MLMELFFQFLPCKILLSVASPALFFFLMFTGDFGFSRFFLSPRAGVSVISENNDNTLPSSLTHPHQLNLIKF